MNVTDVELEIGMKNNICTVQLRMLFTLYL